MLAINIQLFADPVMICSNLQLLKDDDFGRWLDLQCKGKELIIALNSTNGGLTRQTPDSRESCQEERQ